MRHTSHRRFVDALFTGLTPCTTLDEVSDAVSTRLADAGMAYFAYAVFVRPGRFDIEHRLLTTYPESWVRHYETESLERVDPVVQKAVATAQPFFWSWSDPDLRANPSAADFLDDAARHGIRAGFTAPIHTLRGLVGILSFASDADWADRSSYAQHWYHDLSLALMYIHNAVARVQAHHTTMHANLTPRERECLSWAAAGKTAWETAKILERSQRTVEYHLDNARKKLGADNIKAAIQKAVNTRLVT
jgi:DNA-binding CsgD family transcriptional regulator